MLRRARLTRFNAETISFDSLTREGTVREQTTDRQPSQVAFSDRWWLRPYQHLASYTDIGITAIGAALGFAALIMRADSGDAVGENADR